MAQSAVGQASGHNYTTSATTLKYRTKNSGNPLEHNDVDANFDILRKAINGVISDVDGVVDRNLTADLSNATLGYAESGKNYPVEKASNKLYVNVPWTNTTYTAGGGLSLSGTTFSHTDTSTQSSVNNSGRTVIQDITLDGYGHITGINSASLSDTNTTYSAGSGITLSGSTFSLSTASATTKGGIKVGNNLSIDSNGVLNATGGSSYSYSGTGENIIWSASGQIATPCLVDDMVFYAAKRASRYYGLYQASLDGEIKNCIVGGNHWPNAWNSTTGPGFRANIYADWQNATSTTIRLYAAHDGRIATWVYNRSTKVSSGFAKYAVNTGGSGFMGRGWQIFGVGAGSNPAFYMTWGYPHSDWNNMEHYTICRNYYHSNPNGEKYYHGDYRYLGRNTRSTIKADNGSNIYRYTVNYPQQCGIGVKGNRAFYCYDAEHAIMHRFIVPGSGNCADNLFNVANTNSTGTTAQLTHDQSFHVPNTFTSGNNMHCHPTVQFDDQGNEVGIAIGTVIDDNAYRYPKVGICGWNPKWGSGK